MHVLVERFGRFVYFMKATIWYACIDVELCHYLLTELTVYESDNSVE